MLQQASSGAMAFPWTRAAIHDTVASIVSQAPYRRDVQRTLLDRLVRWIGEVIDRIFVGVRGVPHGREVAVAAAIVLALLVAGRILYARRLRAHAEEELARSEVDTRTTGDPWREAERLASGGQYTEAAHALYRGVVVALAARGFMRVHASKTSGDYIRELRRLGAAAEAPFRRFGGRYDRIIYGTGVCDETGYRALRDDAAIVLAMTQRERAA